MWSQAIGYGRLCDKLLQVYVDKRHSNSNWTWRPLKDSQVIYDSLHGYIDKEIDKILNHMAPCLIKCMLCPANGMADPSWSMLFETSFTYVN